MEHLCDILMKSPKNYGFFHSLILLPFAIFYHFASDRENFCKRFYVYYYI